jgi:hypothetical protein
MFTKGELDHIDEVMTRQIRNITLGVVAVTVARGLSNAAGFALGDVCRRLVDLKMPFPKGHWL